MEDFIPPVAQILAHSVLPQHHPSGMLSTPPNSHSSCSPGAPKPQALHGRPILPSLPECAQKEQNQTNIQTDRQTARMITKPNQPWPNFLLIYGLHLLSLLPDSIISTDPFRVHYHFPKWRVQNRHGLSEASGKTRFRLHVSKQEIKTDEVQTRSHFLTPFFLFFLLLRIWHLVFYTCQNSAVGA